MNRTISQHAHISFISHNMYTKDLDSRLRTCIQYLSKIDFPVPSGKPTITAAHNTSSTSIQLIWRPPPKSSINGEFLGYQISHRPRNDNSSGNVLTVQQQIKDPEVTQYTIQDLQPFTQYLVSLRVVNPAGSGPETKVVVMTDEGGKSNLIR